MKLEVGKTYVDESDYVVEVLFEHFGTFWAVSGDSYRNYNDRGVFIGAKMDYDLVKEYTPPRPDVEVLGDAICYLYVFLDDLRDEYEGEKWKAVKSIIKEAEEMKKRMERK